MKILSFSLGILTPKLVKELNGCIVVLDTETTGFSQYRDRIVEFGAIKLKNGKEIDRISFLINPGFRMNPKVIEVHGITDEMVADKPMESFYIPKLVEFFSDCDVIVGHNVKFDLRFIEETFKRNGYKFDCNYLDTLDSAQVLVHNTINHKLGTLADYYGIKTPNAHRALADVETTVMLLRYLCYEVMKNNHAY